MDPRNETYTFADIPKKRKFLLQRLKEIYPTTKEKEFSDILDSVKIKFREQEERGASNHKKKVVYLPLHDFKKYHLKTRNDVIIYLENPKSTVTHETIHIFQNLSETFPHVQYLEQKTDGKFNIDYNKYWNDPGEKQSRLEQVRELLDWGMTKGEIINFLHNKVHDDTDLWSRIVDHAMELRKNNI